MGVAEVLVVIALVMTSSGMGAALAVILLGIPHPRMLWHNMRQARIETAAATARAEAAEAHAKEQIRAAQEAADVRVEAIEKWGDAQIALAHQHADQRIQDAEGRARMATYVAQAMAEQVQRTGRQLSRDGRQIYEDLRESHRRTERYRRTLDKVLCSLEMRLGILHAAYRLNEVDPGGLLQVELEQGKVLRARLELADEEALPPPLPPFPDDDADIDDLFSGEDDHGRNGPGSH